MTHVALSPNDKIDFIRFKNMKFAYSMKLFHVIEQNNRDKTY